VPGVSGVTLLTLYILSNLLTASGMFWGAFGPRGSIPAARTFRIRMASIALVTRNQARLGPDHALRNVNIPAMLARIKSIDIWYIVYHYYAT
jgi:hypothetical protein